MIDPGHWANDSELKAILREGEDTQELQNDQSNYGKGYQYSYEAHI